MAGYRNTSITLSIVTIFVLVSSFSLRVLVKAQHDDSQTERSNGTNSFGQHIFIIKTYGFEWTKSALSTLRYNFSNFNDDIESVECTSNDTCAAALPGLEKALMFDSNIPSAPYCTITASNATALSYCTCGDDRCVSYSRELDTGDPFYYCGPCGYVGSQCTSSCTHKLAECRGGYCECIQDGTFYNMSSCYISLYGQEMMVNIIVGMTGVLFCCAALAFGYHRLRNHRYRRGSIYSERGSGTARRESPSNDTPPTYDDVMEKLPSYQDALNMSTTGDNEDGMINPAFEGDEAAPSAEGTTHNDSPNSGFVAPSQTKETYPGQVLDHTNSPTPCSDAEDVQENQAPSETEKCTASTPPVTGEQHGLGTQPIELLLLNTLRTQPTTTTL